MKKFVRFGLEDDGTLCWEYSWSKTRHTAWHEGNQQGFEVRAVLTETDIKKMLRELQALKKNTTNHLTDHSCCGTIYA